MGTAGTELQPREETQGARGVGGGVWVKSRLGGDEQGAEGRFILWESKALHPSAHSGLQSELTQLLSQKKTTRPVHKV